MEIDEYKLKLSYNNKILTFLGLLLPPSEVLLEMLKLRNRGINKTLRNALAFQAALSAEAKGAQEM